VRAGWSGDVGELLDRGGDGVAVAFEGLAFVVGGVDLFARGRPSGAAVRRSPQSPWTTTRVRQRDTGV
jgi:hypothetical protein